MAKDLKVVEFEGSNSILFKRYHYGTDAEPVLIQLKGYQEAIIEKNGQETGPYGPGRHEIFATKKGLFGIKRTDNETADVIVFSKTAQVQVLWGTPNAFEVKDNDLGFVVHMFANGVMDIRVKNPKVFYERLVAADPEASTESISNRLRDDVVNFVKDLVPRAIRENKIPLTELVESHKGLGDTLRPQVAEMLDIECGLELVRFIIKDIVIKEKDQLIEMLNRDNQARLDKAKRLEREAEEEEKRLKKLNEMEEYRARRIAEQERAEDRAFGRKVQEHEMSSRDLATYVLLMQQLDITPTLDNLPLQNIGVLSGVRTLRSNDSIKPKRVCPNCNKVITGEGAFCPVCGFRIAGDAKLFYSPNDVMTNSSAMNQLSNVLSNQMYVNAVAEQIQNNPQWAQQLANAIAKDPELRALFAAVKK